MTVQNLISLISKEELIDIRSTETSEWLLCDGHISDITQDILSKEVKTITSYCVDDNTSICLLVD